MRNFRSGCILSLLLLVSVFWVQVSAVHAANNILITPELLQEGKLYEVSPDGTKDFVTIQEGVDHAASGDTLLIYPGTYEENVVIEDKTVNLVGVSQQHCILTANSDNYHNIPLTIAAGTVSNLTICGTSGSETRTVLSGEAELLRGENVISMNRDMIYIMQDQYSGYVIHVDQFYSEGKTLRIENCKIISENNYCIGLGCWDRAEITVDNCELIAGGDGGCVFIHNMPYLWEVGKAHVTISNSSFKNYVNPYVIAVHSKGKSSPVDLTFQNVKVSTVAYEDNECYNVTNANTWFNIDQLKVPGVQTVLMKNGYLDPQRCGELVHQYTAEQQLTFNELLYERSSPLGKWPPLEEGITYWESAIPVLSVPGRIRHNVDITNANGEISVDGWCGLSGIYLTEDSFGNTLPEMNYPGAVNSTNLR